LLKRYQLIVTISALNCLNANKAVELKSIDYFIELASSQLPLGFYVPQHKLASLAGTCIKIEKLLIKATKTQWPLEARQTTF
jgi:hypothetical protein